MKAFIDEALRVELCRLHMKRKEVIRSCHDVFKVYPAVIQTLDHITSGMTAIRITTAFAVQLYPIGVIQIVSHQMLYSNVADIQRMESISIVYHKLC